MQSLRLASVEGDVWIVDDLLERWNTKNHNIDETDMVG